MSNPGSDRISDEDPPQLRLWPAVALLIISVSLFSIPRLVVTRQMGHFVSQFGTLILSPVLLLGWWVFFSRARGPLRWYPALAFVLPIFVLMALVYKQAPMNLMAWGPSFVALLWLSWLILGRAIQMTPHVAGVCAVILAGWGVFSLVRIDEADAEVFPELRWVWSPTKEAKFLAEKALRNESVTNSEAVTITPGDWPEFRGPGRDSRVSGVRIETDWTANPPKQLWKQRVGPGWGTFSVVGNRLFTQEQRGEKECVVCYDADTGAELWEFAEAARFYEGIAGAGPRGTPTIHEGKLYAQGATGYLVCLDARTGKPIWITDIKQSTGAAIPQWGFASSPLIVQDLVIVYAGAPGGKGTAAFDAATGKLSWASGDATHSYSSAQLAKLGGVEQVLMVSDIGLESFLPRDGKRLWKFDWVNPGGNRVCQPTVIDDSSVLINTGAGTDLGSKRLKITRNDSDSWKVDVVWTTRKLKAYFNDGVQHDGHFYGFDDKSLCCIDLADGKQKWSAGTRYGHGQVLLLAEQGILVVQAVDGKVSLVEATPEDWNEVARIQGIEGKTWNHPVLVRDRLYIRNSEEAACYQLKKK